MTWGLSWGWSSNMLNGLVSSEGLMVWDNLLPRVAHLQSWKVGTGCHWQDPLVPHQVDLSTGLLGHPHGTMIGFTQRERSQSTRRKPQCLYNLASKVTNHNVLMVVGHHWFHRSPWFPVRGECRGQAKLEVGLLGRLSGHWWHQRNWTNIPLWNRVMARNKRKQNGMKWNKIRYFSVECLHFSLHPWQKSDYNYKISFVWKITIIKL